MDKLLTGLLSKSVALSGGGGGGGVFILACEDFGRMFGYSFPACAFFLLFFKWRLARAH